MYDTLLVPLDGSKRAEAILRHVEELAGQYGATVIFLQVVELVPLNVGSGGLARCFRQTLIDVLSTPSPIWLPDKRNSARKASKFGRMSSMARPWKRSQPLPNAKVRI